MGDGRIDLLRAHKCTPLHVLYVSIYNPFINETQWKHLISVNIIHMVFLSIRPSENKLFPRYVNFLTVIKYG